MIDKTVLELVDRLVATSNRAAIAESENERLKTEIERTDKLLDDARRAIKETTDSLITLKEELEEEKKHNSETISYWYVRANKLEKELEALKKGQKDDSEGTGST